MKINLPASVFAFIILAVSCTKEATSKRTESTLSTNTGKALSFSIGDHYGGGIIFYIDTSGVHGLIADTVDLQDAKWLNSANDLNLTTHAKPTAVGKGFMNTRKIVAAQGDSGKYVARECIRLKRNGFNDWFLPSKDELNLLYLNKAVVGGFSTGDYWSSSENTKSTAFLQSLANGTQSYGTKAFSLHVRAIRAF